MAFKGGTSLSKCFGLIRRFSEDIDLILDWRVIGYEKDEPWQERSGTKQDKFNKEANRRTEIFLQNELIPQMIEDLRNALDEDFMVSIDKKDHQTVLFEYPKVFAPQYLTQAVRLEIGALAAWTPSEVIGIKPDIYSAYPMLFNGDHIEVRTVLPERTFWEKATILHHEANRPKELRMPNRYARHYYDLYQMSHSEYKDRAFQNLELFRKVVAFKEKFYPRKWAKYEQATPKMIRLMPNEYRLKELKKDYENMNEMFFGESPGFEEVMSKISLLEKEIHEILK